MSTLVKKIIFRGYEGLDKLYLGNELIFYTEPEPAEWKGLTFEALEPSRISYSPSSVSTAQYSYDAVNWASADNVIIHLNTGEKVFFKGNITTAPTSSDIAKFTMSGKISASGSIMSLQASNPADKTINYDYEFQYLFTFCSSLTQAPELPATTLKNYCYDNMFDGCSSLTTAPALPATTLGIYCYQDMFADCTSLTTAPALPATTLETGCYQSMFWNCSSLTTAPELPSIYLSLFSYNWMFYGCTSLNEIHIAARENINNSNLQNWVDGVAPTGDFYCYDASLFTKDSASGIPNGWTIHAEVEPVIEYDGLTFEALEPSTIQYVPSTVASTQYSYDTVNWVSADNVTINLNAGDRVFFKGNITGNQSNTDFARFRITTGKVSASGSLMSLQAGNPQDKSLLYNYEFFDLFFGCTALVTAPELPATSLTTRCYYQMFRNTGLEITPELPSMNLVQDCYRSMFYDCKLLTTAKELPATSLVSGCYAQIFLNCSNLNYIKALFTTTPSTTYTQNWVSGVASTGTFVKNKSATWTTKGVNGIPTGWTVQTA